MAVGDSTADGPPEQGEDLTQRIDGERVLRHLLQPIRPWLDDPATTEVVINRPGEVGVEANGAWSWHCVPDYTYEQLDALAILAAYMTGRDVDESHPLCSSTLPDGQRIQICRPPSTPPGIIAVAIRKPATKVRRLDDVDFETLFVETNIQGTWRNKRDRELIELYHARQWRDFFKMARRMRKTIGTCGQTGSGKAQPYHSKVLTPTGFREIGSLRVGDAVSTPSGEVSRICGVFPQGEKETFRITFYDGRQVECSDDHLWKVWNWSIRYETGKTHATRKTIDGARWIVAPLSEIRKWGVKAKRAAVPLISPCGVELASQALPVDPYALGVLLGDGCFGSNPSIRLATADRFILDRVEEKIPDYHAEHQGRFDYRLLMRKQKKVSPLRKALEGLGVMGCRSHEKFVPEIYKSGSVNQRLELLRGLMDTDGSVGGKGTHATFSSTSERLARDVQEIAWSLGSIATLRGRQTYYTYKGEKRAGMPSWRVSMVMPDISLFFSLPRKLAECKQKSVRHRLAIKSIEPIGKQPCVCIAIDHQGHLYITDNYVVTHNTDLLKRLLDCSNPSLRIVSIETDEEFANVGPANRVSLLYGKERGGVRAEDAVAAALRLRPDEIWMQEVRGGEAFAFLRALAAGHPGGCTSWHAEQGHEFDALEMMVKQHPAGNTIPEAKVRQYLREYIDIVVWCARGESGFSAPHVWFKAVEEITA